MTHEDLEQILLYDPNTGAFYWKKKRGVIKAGSLAGTRDRDGYIKITINKKPHFAHRLAWLISKQEQPPALIDHINRTRDDNRIANLRKCSASENLQNSKTPKHNRSGRKGVSFIKNRRKWAAYIQINNKTIHLGIFCDYADAVNARAQGEARYHTTPSA